MGARLLVRWTLGACRFARPIVLISLVVTVWLSQYAIKHLHVDSDTGRVISEELPWRRAFLAYERAFPQMGDEIQVVIDGTTPEAAETAQTYLADRFRERADIYEDVYVPAGGPFMRRHALLFLEPNQLEELRDHVLSFREHLLYLEESPTLSGLVYILERAMNRAVRNDPPGALTASEVEPLLALVAEALVAQMERVPHQVSWREVLTGRVPTQDDRRRFVTVKPRLDYTTSFPAERAMDHVRKARADLESIDRHVRVHITGSEAIEHESSVSAVSSTRRAALVALLGVGIVLLIGLRSIRLFLASLVTLVAGLIGTAAFAAAAVGSLNLISITFAVLYVGLGIDYAVHFCLGYAEARAESGHEDAVEKAATGVGKSLVLSALTTGVCFYAFIPSDFVGVAQLGLIAGTGMFISLLVTLTLLPALLTLPILRLPQNASIIRRLGEPPGPAGRWLGDLVRRRARTILVVAALATVAGLVATPRIRFDHDPLNLSDPRSESMVTYHGLISDPNTVPMTVSTLASSANDAAEVAERLERLASVREAVTPEDLVPHEQAARLDIIAEMRQTLGPAPSRDEAGAGSNSNAVLTAVHDLREALRNYAREVDSDRRRALARFTMLLRAWDRWFREWPPDTQSRLSEELAASLLGTLPWNLQSLRDALEADSFEFEDLPASLRSRWIGRDGVRRVQVVPEGTLDETRALSSFVEEVRARAPDVTGIPVNSLETGRIAVRAFREAFSLAAVAISAVLLLSLRRPRRVALVLVPMVAAAALTFGGAVATEISINFANIIALPLLLGVGVDNCIHLVNRAGAHSGAPTELLSTSTARAVFFSTVTTTVSFGNLALSSHRGLSSMGNLLTVGMVSLLLVTLIALPALLQREEGAR